MAIITSMKSFRIVVGVLAVVVLLLSLAAVILPPVLNDQAALLELLYPSLAMPILTLNFWAWMYPEIIEFYFLGHERKTQGTVRD